MPDRQFVFAPFRLDLVTEQLWQGEELVPLRPKLFAVLRYLVEHAGRVVTQEELRTAVWPATVVSESVLRGAIRELREVLGDAADAVRFVETIPHRGYRFVAPLTAAHAGQTALRSARPFAPQPVPRPGNFLLIGRDAELGRLQEWLESALQGTRQVVFVTGEPGIGKTTVVDTFLAYAAGRGDLWIGRGQCVEHYGPSEAYLPVLEALWQLCRRPGGEQVIPLLSHYAPTWLAQMPGLLGEAELAAAQRRAQGATRERMLRELAEAIEALTAATAVVLVLEDLHWSDYSTLDLLALLAQRRGPARLLVLGTYRPADVIVSGHPLKALKQELQAHGRCEELPLGFFTEVEVAQYLRARFAQQQLPPELGGAIHRSTEGNPLFLVNVVDYWVSQGVLVETAGRWHLAARVEDLTAGVPESLRQMIEKQVGRLTPEEGRLIEAASVAGVEFATAAIAAGLQEQTERVEEWCERLAKRGQFLQARGTETLADGTVIGRHGFRHALYQQVLYERVAVMRRVRLHRRIGAWGEQVYGAQGSNLAAELAMHFERGHDYARAVQYLGQAAKNAGRRHALQEAVALLRKALELLKLLPDTPERTQQELALHIALGVPLLMTKGYAAPEVEHTYARARELCQQLGESPQLLPALAGLFQFYFVRAELGTARELGKQLLTLAQRQPDPVSLARAHMSLGLPLFWLGEFTSAREHLEQGVALDDPQPHSPPVSRAVQDRIVILSYAAVTLWQLGYPDQALERSHAAIALARESSHPFNLAMALDFAAWLQQFRREWQAVQAQAEAAMTLSTEHGFLYWLAVGTILKGWAQAEQGDGEAGLMQLHQGLAAYRTTRAELGWPHWLALLIDGYEKSGQTQEGLAAVAEALARVEKTGERWYEAELQRLQGQLTLQKFQVPGFKFRVPSTQHLAPSTQAEAEAEACFHKAIEIARRQQAKSLELRATMSLARLWQRQGKKKQARQLLAEIYGWFTEGFETKDLQEAKALLAELA
jgi:DNA-binding winged helix-turn-helix (wHTH) protein/predicted ATPase